MASSQNTDELNRSLWTACADGDVSRVEQLLKMGADVSYRGEGDKTPLGIAAYMDHAEVVELLVKHGADTETSDKERSILFWACGQENMSAVKSLVKCGADIESEKTSGATPFLVACNVGNMEIIRYLVSKGAKTSISYKGFTPLTLAEREKHKKVVDYLTNVDQFKLALDKALLEESIDVEFTKLCIHGPAGSGKTCLQCLILNEPPPEIRESTDLSTSAVLGGTRDVKTYSMAATSSDSHSAINCSTHVPQSIKRADKDQSLQYLLQETKSILPLNVSSPKPQHTTELVTETTSGTRRPKLKKTMQCIKNFFGRRDSADTARTNMNNSSICCGLLSILPDDTEVEGSFKVRWMYCTDSGGQPAFQDIAPAFLRHSSIIVLTLKLNEKLNAYPKLDYAHKGRYICQQGRKQLTNLEMVINLARSLSSVLQTSVCSELHDCIPKLLIVGTFHDEMGSCSESLEEKNQILQKCLQPYRKSIILTSSNHIIHPVNTLVKVEEGRQMHSEELCSTILCCHGTRRGMKIRLSWLIFHFEIFSYAESKEKEVLSLDECCEVGRTLHMTNQKMVVEALKYLDSLGVLFYFFEVLPKIVFVRPQIILKCLSDLVSLSFFKDMQPFPEYASTLPQGSHFQLCNEGCFTARLLEALYPRSLKEVFPVQSFLYLMKYLLVIAEAPSDNCSNFFLPCALPWRPNSEMSFTRRDLDPIHLVWHISQAIPYGIFLGTINFLLSRTEKPQFKLPSIAGGDIEQCRNAVHLECVGGGILLLVDNVCNLELRYTGLVSDCPEILLAVKCGIVATAKRFHYHQDVAEVYECFFSSCEKMSENHMCMVQHGALEQSNKKHIWCQSHGCMKPLSADQCKWFEYKVPYPQVLNISELPQQGNLDSEHIGNIVRALKPVSHHWKMLGLFLGVRYYELEAIEAGKSNPTSCLMDMIDKWIKSDCECTSKHIEAALKDINVTVKRS